jgi:hypothetical protein
MKSTVPTEEQVRARAYELFVQRGCEHGHHQEDWLAAERELRAEPKVSAIEVGFAEQVPETNRRFEHAAGRAK